MFELPAQIITLLFYFAPIFTKPTWEHAKTLAIGAILCPGARRITSVLKIMGLSQERRFEKYHRFLNRSQWNSLHLARILLGLLLQLLPENYPILIAVDETLERRKGKKIKAKGCYRDAVRSSHTHVVKSFGLKWNCMTLLVPLPFCQRIWALPFMTILGPSKKANEKSGRPHKTSIDWTTLMMRVVCRWIKRSWFLIGDGGYACIALAKDCVKNGVTLISRLRLDAQIFEFPPQTSTKKRGRKATKGQRLSIKTLAQMVRDLQTTVDVMWYGGKKKSVKVLSRNCLWQKSVSESIAIQMVIVIDPDNPGTICLLFSTNLNMSAEKIVEYFVLRWNIEVTFEESRRHLGVETQRQWADKSIARTTPLLLGLYSVVTVMALKLKDAVATIPQKTAWYNKNSEVTFSDIIAIVRRAIWAEKYFSKSANSPDFEKIDNKHLKSLIDLMLMAA